MVSANLQHKALRNDTERGLIFGIRSSAHFYMIHRAMIIRTPRTISESAFSPSPSVGAGTEYLLTHFVRILLCVMIQDPVLSWQFDSLGIAFYIIPPRIVPFIPSCFTCFLYFPYTLIPALPNQRWLMCECG